jgi:RNA polymerase alpha subunit
MNKPDDEPSVQGSTSEKAEDARNTEPDLSMDEQLVLRMREVGVSYKKIADKFFGGSISRQAVCDTAQKLEQKAHRVKTRERYRGHEFQCPIDELPQPYRTRHALLRAGYERLGQVVPLTDEQLMDIPGMGKGSVFTLRRMIRAWGLDQPDFFCLRCAAGLRLKRKRDQSVTCNVCGQTYRLVRNHAGKGLRMTANNVTLPYAFRPLAEFE